ncbi:reverse transcriptase domain-containing protein [Tanacetum coccineum]
MSIRLADQSFQYPVGIAENMLVEVGKFTFPIDFVILKMEEDSKVPLILGRPFLHTADAVIHVKQKQLNLGVRSLILYSIEGTPLEEKLFVEFDEFMAMTIKKSIDEPPTDLELKPLPKHLEYEFLEEPSFLHVIISSQLFEQNKEKLVYVLKRYKQDLAWKTTDIPVCASKHPAIVFLRFVLFAVCALKGSAVCTLKGFCGLCTQRVLRFVHSKGSVVCALKGFCGLCT